MWLHALKGRKGYLIVELDWLLNAEKQPWTLPAFSDAQHDPKADCKMMVSVSLSLLLVGSEYKSQAVYALADPLFPL